MIWREEFEIGIRNIDEQHKELFARYNNLLQCIKKSEDSEQVAKNVEDTLDFLSEYIIYHFDHEEKYQQEVCYPKAKCHKEIHNKFKRTILEFKREFIKNPENHQELIKNFTGFFSTWLINHICDEDQKIYDFVHSKNIELNKENLEKPIDIMTESINNVLKMMAQVEVEVSQNCVFEKNKCLAIKIDIIGDFQKELIFIFPNEFIVEILKKMTGSDELDVDSFAAAALKETVNTIAGHVINNFQRIGKECDITVPELVSLNNLEQGEFICFESSVGKFKLIIV